MTQIYYWSPCLTKVGTYKSTINSALSLARYSKNLFSVKIINICGEWDTQKDFFKKNNIDVIDLGFNYFNLLPKTGFIKSRISYFIMITLSFIPLLKLLIQRKPDFLVIHLLTILPLIVNNFLNFKTKMILRISGLPKLNFIRKLLWKSSSKKIFKITCPSIDLQNQLIENKIFEKGKLVFLPDPIIILKDIQKKVEQDNHEKRSFFISVGRLTKQKNFGYLINEFSKFAQIDLSYDLHIFGEGEEKDKLKKLIVKHKMQNRIYLMGYKENINFFMKKAEALILSSLWEDPGFVLIEATINNLFLISSDCKNGPKEILDNGRRGLLFKNNENNALFNSFEKYFELKENKKTKPLIIAAKKYCKKYTLFQHYKIFNSILSIKN